MWTTLVTLVNTAMVRASLTALPTAAGNRYASSEQSKNPEASHKPSVVTWPSAYSKACLDSAESVTAVYTDYNTKQMALATISPTVLLTVLSSR